MSRAPRLVAALFTVALAGTAFADADLPLISASTSHLGRIDLYLGDVQGTRGAFYEVVGKSRIRLGEVTVHGSTAERLPDAMTWSCTRRTRNVVADVVHPDGTTASTSYVARTPSCEDRLTVDAPRSTPPGSRVDITVIDSWNLGDIEARLCVTSPTGRRSCRPVRFFGKDRVALPVTATRDGTWQLDAQLEGTHVRRTMTVGFANPDGAQDKPVLLATGDSTVQNIDAALGDRLHRSFRLERGFRPGSGISHDPDHWVAYAAKQVREFRPRLTVISMGAAEGYDMQRSDGTMVTCCTDAWMAEYEQRVRTIMATFLRKGHGHLMWLTLPAPEPAIRRQYAAMINTIVDRAAAATPGVVRVRVDKILTPGFHYRRAMRYRGKRRIVRTPDGIHLTPAGAGIATDLIMRELSRLDWN